ncbi:hypothetical protein LCGC14_2970870, partial [marine sediment metagenome]
MSKPNATKTEVLLAIAMSNYYQTTHVHYMPAGKKYTTTLMAMRSTGNVIPMGKHFYTLTKKGRDFLVRQNVVL